MGQRAPTARSDRRRGGLRVLMLRTAPLPLGHLRRADPAEARGLPDQGPVQRGDPAGPGVRRPHPQRLRRQGQVDRTGELRAEQGPGRRHPPDRHPVRADPVGHPGDAAAEDAARRDLRGAHPGRSQCAEAPGGRILAQGAGPTGGAARRDLQDVRREDPGRVPDVDAAARHSERGAGGGPERRDREPRAVRRGRQQGAARARHAAGRRPAVRPGHGPGLRRPERAPGAAPGTDPELRASSSTPRPSGTATSRPHSGRCPPSSTSRG